MGGLERRIQPERYATYQPEFVIKYYTGFPLSWVTGLPELVLSQKWVKMTHKNPA
jgi:hypothetical protein